MGEPVGAVAALWRYPVKSMMGEEINASDIGKGGLLGDRAFALVDVETGKVAKKWATLLDFRAAYVAPPQPGRALPPVRITFPDGSFAMSDDPDLARQLSEETGRRVEFRAAGIVHPSLEEYGPNIEGLNHRNVVADEAMLAESFFDGAATVHLLTSATLDCLRASYPQGRFDVRRFRPNVVITSAGETGFIENEWIGRTVALGEDVQLKIDRPCPRCVMTTLPQTDLPKDTGILKTAAQLNMGNVGVYASVKRGGRLRMGDEVLVG